MQVQTKASVAHYDRTQWSGQAQSIRSLDSTLDLHLATSSFISGPTTSSSTREVVSPTHIRLATMPALAVRDANVPPPPSRKEGKNAAAAKPPLPTQPATANPLVVQRCIAFLNKLHTQYDASQNNKSTQSHSHHPALPDLSSHLASLASTSVTLLHVGSAYEVVGHWLHSCEKHSQAVAILRNAATVYDACNATGKALLARIDVGRALNAAALALQQQADKTEQEREMGVKETQQHWLTVREQVQGKELRLESYACYHDGPAVLSTGRTVHSVGCAAVEAAVRASASGVG